MFWKFWWVQNAQTNSQCWLQSEWNNPTMFALYKRKSKLFFCQTLMCTRNIVGNVGKFHCIYKYTRQYMSWLYIIRFNNQWILQNSNTCEQYNKQKVYISGFLMSLTNEEVKLFTNFGSCYESGGNIIFTNASWNSENSFDVFMCYPN